MGSLFQDQDKESGLFSSTPKVYGEPDPVNPEPEVDEDKNLITKKKEAKTLLSRKKETQTMQGRKGMDVFRDDIVDATAWAIPPENSIKLREPERTIDIKGVTTDVQPAEGQSWGMSTFDFLFGSEAAAVGIAHDSEGFSWNVENLKQQWSEQPLWVNALALTSLVGTVALPAYFAAKSSLKVGKLASLLGKTAINEAEEISKWKTLNMIDDSITSHKMLGDKSVKILRQQENVKLKFARAHNRALAAERGELNWVSNPGERAIHEFDKRFGNAYYNIVNATNEGSSARDLYHENLDKLWKAENLGKLFTDMPPAEAGPAISAYIMDKIAPGVVQGATKFGKLPPEHQKWAEFIYGASKSHQAEALEEGFISPETFRAIGEVHWPAQMLGTADPGVDMARTHLVPIRAQSTRKAVAGFTEQEVPRTGLGRLFGKTKKVIKPTGEYDYIALKLMEVPRLDNPTLLHRKGTHAEVYQRLLDGKLITDPADLTVRGYVTDRLLLTNFRTVRDIAMNPNYIASAKDVAAWGGDAAKAYKTGFVSLHNAGPHASAALARMIGKATGKEVTELPWVRKEIFEEIFGPDGMMKQSSLAGVDMLELGTTMFKTAKTAGSIPTHLQNLGGNTILLSQAGWNVLAPENVALLGRLGDSFNKIADIQKAAKEAGVSARSLFNAETGLLKGVNLGEVTINGKTFNLNKELFDPAVRELIEDSAFQSVEGAGNITSMMKRLRKDQYLTRGVAEGYIKVKNIAQLGGKAKWFDAMTLAYLEEDMLPKMGYYMHLRGQGFTKSAAVIEVGRRLPMYNTVGSSIKLGRKVMFPWATFSTEAMRITKNNIMDHPLRMIPWLRASGIMQTMAASVGISGDADSVAEAKRQLPFWAQSPTSIVTEGKGGAAVGGALTGGLVGATAGALLTQSAAGAYVGGAIGGALAGFGAAMLTDKEHENQIRGAVLDFLPHSSFMLTTTSPDFGGDIVPWKDARGFLTQLPAEPFAILRPLLDIFEGKTAHGSEIGGNGLSKIIAGLLGFIAPPIIQNYGFKLTTPEVPLFGDPTGITNVARGLIDTGNAIDPMTGLPGSLSNDFLLKNFSIWRSYAGSGEQQLANESYTEQSLGKTRTHLTRNLAFHLENGNDAEVVKLLSEVQGTFANQYVHDPRLAQNKYGEWLESYTKQIGRHPMLRNWSEEELVSRLRQANDLGGRVRVEARSKVLETLGNELVIRRSQAKGNKGIFNKAYPNKAYPNKAYPNSTFG